MKFERAEREEEKKQSEKCLFLDDVKIESGRIKFVEKKLNSYL